MREQERFIGLLPAKHKLSFLEGNYEKERFYETVKGMEKIPEGGERCFACYRLRLSEAIKEAEKGGFDYVTTTLTISPMKNAQKLNEIGEELCRRKSLFIFRYSARFPARSGLFALHAPASRTHIRSNPAGTSRILLTVLWIVCTRFSS